MKRVRLASKLLPTKQQMLPRLRGLWSATTWPIRSLWIACIAGFVAVAVGLSLVRALVCVGLALFVHWAMVDKMGSVMGRYRGPFGRIVNPIALEPLHLAGLALAVLGGLSLSVFTPDPILLFQLVFAGLLFFADLLLIIKAIKWVDRFSDDLD